MAGGTQSLERVIAFPPAMPDNERMNSTATERGTMTTTTDTRDDAYTTWLADVASGRVFALHAASHRGEIGYRPPVNRDAVAHALAVMSRMLRESDALAPVALAVIRATPLYGTPGQVGAAIYSAAMQAMATEYRDTIGQASPEPNRESDARRDYTLGERLTVLAWLQWATAKVANGVPAYGWTLARAIAENNLRVPADPKAAV